MSYSMREPDPTEYGPEPCPDCGGQYVCSCPEPELEELYRRSDAANVQFAFEQHMRRMRGKAPNPQSLPRRCLAESIRQALHLTSEQMAMLESATRENDDE